MSEENITARRKRRFLHTISMKPEFAREVMDCLPTGRTLFRYAKDDYAFLLLRMMSGREPCIHKLRQTTARKLLEKPAVKPFLAACAGGTLAPDALPERRSSRSYRRISCAIFNGSRRKLTKRSERARKPSRSGAGRSTPRA